MRICASSITALLRHAASPPPIKHKHYAYVRDLPQAEELNV